MWFWEDYFPEHVDSTYGFLTIGPQFFNHFFKWIEHVSLNHAAPTCYIQCTYTINEANHFNSI